MATGVLGQSAPAALTNTTVYTVPSSTTATMNIAVVNTSTSPIALRMALSATGTPSDSEWLEYDTVISANAVLERTGIVAQATKNIVVYATSAGLNVSVYGYEET